jgi:pimeloyl-ACP methyl ester carboxylesterase
MVTIVGIAIIFISYFIVSVLGAMKTMEIPRELLEVTPDATGLEYENVAFTSRDDNISLRGWYFPATDDSVIVMVNGGFRNRVDENSDTLGLTGALVEKGHNVLLFDLRGRGESEGEARSLSNIDEDIGGAFDYLIDRGHALDNICLMGFCSGAVQACIYASRNDTGMLILDGCFISVPTMVVRQAATTPAPEFLAWMFIPGCFLMTKLIYGYELVNPIDVVGDIQCPILFIHEELDEFTSLEETERLYNAATNPANEIWEVKDSDHSQAFLNYPEEYTGKISSFVMKHSNGTPGQ